jgi:hypothetical protein
MDWGKRFGIKWITGDKDEHLTMKDVLDICKELNCEWKDADQEIWGTSIKLCLLSEEINELVQS